MRKNFTIAAAQFTPVSGDCEANLRKMAELCDRTAEAGASLIVLPELALTGYYLKADALRALAVPQEGSWSGLLREKAEEHRIFIAVGYPEKADTSAPAASQAHALQMFNSCLLIGPDGKTIGNARKRYLWGREKRLFLPGDSFDVFDTELGKIAVLLCYDMEYPEPSRIVSLNGADLILCPAAWSKKAAHRWRVETAANALFNLVYVAGANFVDEFCCGNARIVGPDGTVIAEGRMEGDGIVTAEVRQEELERCREDIPYRKDLLPETLEEAACAARKGLC